jgi:hypothetical protein
MGYGALVDQDKWIEKVAAAGHYQSAKMEAGAEL